MGYARITGPGPNPSGLCQCGCGQRTPMARLGSRKLGWVAGKPIRYVCGHSGKLQRSNEPRVTDSGYVMISMPEHPRADSKGYVREHIVVAERALGKPLPDGAEVHHVNGQKDDNRPSNLVVCQDRGYHMRLHKRQRALAECGHAGWIRCEGCRRYRNPAEMSIRRDRLSGKCRPCMRRTSRQRRARRRRIAEVTS